MAEAQTNTVHVHKADPLGDPIDDLVIEARIPLPPVENAWLFLERNGLFKRDAKVIVKALCASLPGGTIDQILCELLDNRASQLRVPSR